jgi:hypothetical protein
MEKLSGCLESKDFAGMEARLSIRVGSGGESKDERWW